MEKVSVIYKGDDSVNFKCPGVFKANVKPGDIIEGVPRETYDNEMKDDKRFTLVSEKIASAGRLKNKVERPTESEDK